MKKSKRSKKKYNPFCPIHRIPLRKRNFIKEGQERYYCIKCLEEKG